MPMVLGNLSVLQLMYANKAETVSKMLMMLRSDISNQLGCVWVFGNYERIVQR